MGKDEILNNAKNNLQLFEKAQTELINARNGLLDTKEDLNKAIQELLIARDSIDEVLKNNSHEEIQTFSEPETELASALENVEVAEDSEKSKAEEKPASTPKKTSKSSSRPKKEEPKIELNEEDELDLGFLDETSSDNDDDIDKIEF